MDRLLDVLRPTKLVDAQGEERRYTRDVPLQSGDALVVTTSGTTGASKGVVLTHDAIRCSALATSARLEVDPHKDRWLSCLPLSHIGGLSVVTRALVTDTPLTVHSGFDAAAVEAASKKGATLVSLVATAARRADTSRFRLVLLGGSAPPEDLAPNMVTTYGMTETGSGVVYNGIALDGVEIKSVNGELWIRAPMIARCYRSHEEETPLVDSEGWLHTGDAGGVDTHTGDISVIGRIGDVVVTGGEKVWPNTVEAVIKRHPGVSDVAVAGRPDEVWGSRVVAFVVPAEPTQPPSLEDIRAWVKAELPPYAAPKELELRSDLPRTISGKIQRNLLDAAPQK